MFTFNHKKSTFFTRRLLYPVLALTLTLLIVTTTQAAPLAPVTFTFDAADDNKATITKTVNGVTITLSNPKFQGNPVSVFRADSDGLWAAADGVYDIDFFQISFDAPVTFQSYEIGVTNAVGTFDLTAASGSSTGNPMNPVGTYNFNGSLSVAAGEMTTLTGSWTSGAFSEIKSITADTGPVSAVGGHTEPASPLALLWPWLLLAAAAATGAIAAVALKRRPA